MFEWYWWVVIGVGLVALAALKFYALGKIMAAQKAKKAAEAELAEE